MNLKCTHINFAMKRREFFGRFAFDLGGATLPSSLNCDAFTAVTAFASLKRQTPGFASDWVSQDCAEKLYEPRAAVRSGTKSAWTRKHE